MTDQLKEIFSRYSETPAEQITPETSILRDLGLNSFAIIEIINEIEDEFGLEIPDSVLPDIKTVGDMLSFLEENR